MNRNGKGDKGKSRRKLIRIAALCMALFLSLSMGSVAVFAEGTYYGTWKEYKAANGDKAVTWSDVAEQMGVVLDKALENFEAGDYDAAYDNINKNGYYGWYETTGFERNVMAKISGARVSEVELQFASTRTIAKNKGTLDEFKTKVEELRTMLKEDAVKLDGGSSGTVKSLSEGREYYGTWKEYKASLGDGTVTWIDVAGQMNVVLDKALENFEAGDYDAAYDNINKNGYYGWYETTGFERNVMAKISGARVSEVELQFASTRTVAKNKGTLEEFQTEVEKLRTMLNEDAAKLDGVSLEEVMAGGETSAEGTVGGGTSKITTFLGCFTIILREGFEAILVVGAIIAYLLKGGSTVEDKTQTQKRVRPVYIGAVLGIVASFISAWILNLLMLANSASQEVIEGVTALIAVVVLYWVSNWMVSKSESEAWSAYIKSKVKSSSEKGSTFALAFTAFLAVYREGAEVILFYQPMLAEGSIGMVWLGFGVGCVCLVGVYIAIHVLSLRLPLKPFFLGTSILMFIMSISFLGSGIKELIEGGVFSATQSPLVSWIPVNEVTNVLGLFPYDQTVFPQLILLVVTIVVFVLQLRRNAKLKDAAKETAEAVH